MSDRSEQNRLVREANDIVAVVGDYVALKPQGQTFKGLCPFHDDRNPSFNVSPQYQNYRCWSCGKSGDVFSFIMEHERLGFREALELLARRAGISLDKDPAAAAKRESRLQLQDVMKWACDQYQQCFLEDDVAEAARIYMAKRRLLGPTLRQFGVGFAPIKGEWLVQRARERSISLEMLEQLGLVLQRNDGSGCFDRFRDRVMFVIRDEMGRPVGFGGRILPSSPLADRGPKYYNSPETPLFNKKEVLFGLDQARGPAQDAGVLAVVEGYTDVVMAHQCGIKNVVATMGTSLTDQHVRKLRRIANRVVLVFDADAGGESGVDRALELFVTQEVDLCIATLPEGLDPFDLLLEEDGAARFQQCLNEAVDALDFKLKRSLAGAEAQTIEGQRRAVDDVLKVIALAPELPGHTGAVKLDLIVTRICRRLGIGEEIVRARLRDLRRQRRQFEERAQQREQERSEEEQRSEQSAPAAPEERQLIELLLAEPDVVPAAAERVTVEEMRHPGLRTLLAGLYALRAEGLPPTFDELRPRLDSPRLEQWAFKQQEVGLASTVDPRTRLEQLVDVFRQRRAKAEKHELQNQLHAADDHGTARDLLRRMQES